MLFVNTTTVELLLPMYNCNSLRSFLSLVLLACVFFMASCENDIKVVQALGEKKTGVEEGKKIESFLSQDGKMKARLTAPLMLRYLDSNRIVFSKTMHVDFYNDSLKIESTLFAKYGTYLQGDSKVFLKDSVIVINIKGDTLFTDELWWDQNRQLFYTDKPAHIRKPGEHFDGMAGMEADQNFRKYTLKQTSGTFLTGDSTMALP